MAATENDENHLRLFAASISEQPMGLAHYRPDSRSLPTRCFGNVTFKVREAGGRMQMGWMFQCRRVEAIPNAQYLIAIHHAVWHSPESSLIDVTPFNEDPKHHPLTHNGDVIFLVDDKAQPDISGDHPRSLASRFWAIGENPELKAHVQELIENEEWIMRQTAKGKWV